MKIARFATDGVTRLGVVDGEQIVDVTSLAIGDDALSLLARREEVEAALRNGGQRYGVESVGLLAPVRPPKFFGVGLNYADHAEEAGLDTPDVPTVFNKQSTCVVGSGESILRPRASQALDYEGELGIVIGRRCRHLTREEAPRVIAGALIANDVSVRDWQMATPTVTMGKSWDTLGPIGPWLTTIDEVEDLHALDIQTWVNGELRQSSNTSHLIFDCYDLIAHLSTVCTLEPGDVIATGTPSGVGALMDPKQFLGPGDTVRIQISGLGTLENGVIDEADDTPWIADPEDD